MLNGVSIKSKTDLGVNKKASEWGFGLITGLMNNNSDDSPY